MTSLTDRYVHATVRSLPEDRRDDIARELTASIDEMVAAQLDTGESADGAERAVLTEMGDPDRLAAGYADRPLHLIGPRYFLVYRRLLTRLLTWVPAIVMVLTYVGHLIGDTHPGAAVGHAVWAGMLALLHVCFWTTLTFFILERTNAETGFEEWTVDSLPDVPEQRQVSLVDTIAGIVVIGIVIVMLVVQHFRSWVDDNSGDHIPVLDPDLWSFWLPFLIAVLVASALLEVWKYAAGRYTLPVVGGVVITSLAWLGPVIWLALEDRILNPALVAELGVSAETVEGINIALIVIAVIIEGITVIDAVVKARGADRAESLGRS